MAALRVLAPAARRNRLVVAGALLAGALLIVAGRAPAAGRPAPLVFEERLHETDRPAALGAALPLVLGGFRALAADVAWLRVQLAWERGDEADVRRWSEVATTIDPDAVGFWLNGARMLAYDFADARGRRLPAGEDGGGAQRRIDAEQAEKALRFLRAGVRRLPAEPLLWIEMGNIHLNRRERPDAAADCYARAVALPRAPLYAERILAGLQWRAERRTDAVATLRRHLATLRQAERTDVDPTLVEAVTLRLAAWERALEESTME